jgi:hypothetical protein
MRNIIGTLFMIHFALLCFSQNNSDKEYGKTLYNVLSLDHKAFSYNLEDPSVLSLRDFESRTNKEDVVVYIVYQVNPEFKNSASIESKPIQKMMDFHIIYDYNYRIFFLSNENLNNILPKIKLADGSTLVKAIIRNHFINEKGQPDNKQLKKSAFDLKKDNGLLSFTIDDKVLKDSSILEIHVKVISKNFYTIQPSISKSLSFEKRLTVSFPAIFNFKIPAYDNLDLLSHTNTSFELLNFMRPYGYRNGDIEKINTISHIYSWKVNMQGAIDFKPEFELNGLVFIPDTDIGITKTEILKVD